MNREVAVWVDTEAGPAAVGRLWFRVRSGRESASFEYDPAWLRRSDSFPLEPALGLDPGPHHTPSGRALFGAFGDCAPDRWGRTLMRRAERLRARAEGRAPRTLLEIDYLLTVDDEARQRALRFQDHEGGPFVAPPTHGRIPPLVELPRLLSASDRVDGERESEADLQLLLASGSSLGGARPKAGVRDVDGHLALAKFPSRRDDTSVVLWEAVALELAARAGIDVPRWRLADVARRKVLLSRRFDRRSERRIPFISAMSMLDASDGDTRSYLEIADSLHRHGASPTADMQQLWRRILFFVLISNTDDHLRNHGFLHDAGGWRLAPAYDLNPVPVDLKPRILSTAIDEDDPTASLDLVREVAPYFRVADRNARDVVRDVARSVKQWRKVASEYGIRAAEIERVATAFEHPDLAAALKVQVS